MDTHEIAANRLKLERKNWRSDHPFGFVAKPITNEDGSQNIFKWECRIPGPQKTLWEGVSYKLTVDFGQGYPVKPPRCTFSKVPPHPNIYPSGTVCLSILNEEQDWKPHLSVKQILLGIQKLLQEDPNLDSPAQLEPTMMYKNDREEYSRVVKKFVADLKNEATPIDS